MDQPTEEHWRPVVGHEGSYEVSDQGRVRSIPHLIYRRGHRPHMSKMRVLRPGYTAGYALVNLPPSGTRTVHTLVAEAFLGPCPSDQEVRHLNGDSRDSRAVNLAYGTHAENEADKRRHKGLQSSVCGNGLHPFDAENTIIQWKGDMFAGKHCRACDRISRKKKAAARKAASTDRG